jgi:hypothetical protein
VELLNQEKHRLHHIDQALFERTSVDREPFLDWKGLESL